MRLFWTGLMIGALTVLSSAAGEPRDHTDVARMALQGRQINASEARAIEARLDQDPWDLDGRITLLGYYAGQGTLDARSRRGDHILWIVTHRPDASVCGTSACHLNPRLEPITYNEARRLWLEKVDLDDDSPAILGNAAAFLLAHDRETALDLLNRAKVLDPYNARWSRLLARLHNLEARSGPTRPSGESPMETYHELRAAYDGTRHEFRRLLMLPDLARAAFHAGDHDAARELAASTLDAVDRLEEFGAHGEALHHGHLVLGLLALEADEIDSAGFYLLEAGRTAGSPSLGSFGPDMTLAARLLERGEGRIVLEYFDLCREFWKTGQAKLDRWTAVVNSGGVPDFGVNLAY